MTDFGELRSLMQQPPSETVWETVVEMYPDGEVNESELSYLHDHLSRWPDEVKRHVPQVWVPDDLNSWPMLVSLAYALELREKHIGAEEARDLEANPNFDL